MRTVPVLPRHRRRISLGGMLSALAGVVWTWGALSHAVGPGTAGICETESLVTQTVRRERIRGAFCGLVIRAPITVDLTDLYGPPDRMPVASTGPTVLSTPLTVPKFDVGARATARQ